MRSLGLYAWFGYDLSLEEALRRMRDAGFDSVMLWWGEFDGGVPLSRQPDLARRLGLEVANAHAPFAGCNHLWLPGEEGARYIDAVVRCALAGYAARSKPRIGRGSPSRLRIFVIRPIWPMCSMRSAGPPASATTAATPGWNSILRQGNPAASIFRGGTPTGCAPCICTTTTACWTATGFHSTE